MHLDSIQFSEYEGGTREWQLAETTFDVVNLIVGRNASGKSRLLNVINGLAKLLRGEIKRIYESGNYVASFSNGKHRYRYELELQNRKVVRERLARDAEVLLDRGKDGVGTIWSEGIRQKIDFETPPDALTAQARRDNIQHPFFEDLHAWAANVRHMQFGTPLGRDQLYVMTQLTPSMDKQSEILDTDQVTKLYVGAVQTFGEEFDNAVVRDLAALGYDCTQVGAEQTHIDGLRGPPVALLFVQEKDLLTKTTQLTMSQGMFRALSVVIQLNDYIFRAIQRTLLIDDIGEGLDFERSQSFIKLLIERALQKDIQLIMTTNDRFVMNGVPLKYWGVLRRRGQQVEILNIRNSERVFREFEELGLNNFDFFSTDFFEEGRK
jgi:energy-coupling factor transporter ATP-binding protein EcfA2